MKLPQIPIHVRVVLLYTLFGGAWILFSDRLLDSIVHDTEILTRIQTVKGWGFVAVSALLIYLLLKNDPYLRRRAEAALRKSEARFSTVFHSSPVGISITNIADGKLIDVNEEFLRLFGFSRQEVLGKTTLDLKIWVNPEERERMVRTLADRGSVRDFATQFRQKSGDLRSILFSTELIELADEQYILGLYRDITESQRSQEKIEQQYQRLASLRAIDTVITSSFDLNITLDIFLERLLAQLNVDAALVLLLRPESSGLEFAAGRGFRNAGIRQLKLRLGEDYAGRAALERRLVSVPDLSRLPGPLPLTDLTAGEDFVAFYALPLIAKGEVKGVLEVFHRAPLDPDEEWMDFFNTLARQAAIAIDNTELFNRLQESNMDLTMAYDETIEGWSRALDLRDKETEGHTQRVTESSVRLAYLLGLKENEIVPLRYGALLHDIGKMGVPDAILFKPTALDAAEEAVMRMHPVYAYELLSPIKYLRASLDIPHYHHEKWDGSGYPEGLKGEQIPLAARLFSVVDVWDALHSNRPYRTSWPFEKIRDYLQSEAGRAFDPRMVEAFLGMMKGSS